ncbi:MAG: hypothetical protein QW744_04800, partial [Candidatus Bathyarchaeia archaeon]
MQKSKKTLSLLITALLTLSMIVAAVPLASAEIVNMTINPSSGVVGTKVLVSGMGANPFGQVKIYWESVAGTVLNTTAADPSGNFSCYVTIPAAVNGPHYIIAQDNLGYANGTQFTVTASMTPRYLPPFFVTKVLPGDSLAVGGSGFSANKTVTVYLNRTTGNQTLGTATTDGVGSFSTSVVVPAIPETEYGTLSLFAVDANNVTATTKVVIDYYVNVMPAYAPPGVSVYISGRIPASKDYEIRINGTTVESGTSSSTGTFSETYTLPTLLAAGTYTVTVVWDVVNSRSTTLTVGPAPSISLSAASGVAGAIVTIQGNGFSSLANVTFALGTTVVNSTAADPRFGPTDITGAFTGTFEVPNLTPGAYVAKVTDQYGASAQTTFTILAAPTTTIALRAAQYMQGDTLSFNIYTTDPAITTVAVQILDPSGGVWWTGFNWTLVSMVTYSTVPYADQVDSNNNPLKLPDDAPTGSWNWTIYYGAKKATGLFTVVEKPTLASVQAQINQLSAQINSLGGNFSSITSQLNSINSQLSSISSTVSGISGAASSAASAANSAKSAADSAKASADAAKAAADAAKASADNAVSAVSGATSA